MKAFFACLIGLALMVSCNEPTKPTNDKLEKLVNERDSLEGLRTTVSQRLEIIEDEIATLDTTVRFTRVTLMEVLPDTFNHYFELYGNVEADQNVTLYPEMGGTVNRILVREGQKVEKGTLLVELDTEVIRNQIKEVTTQLELASTLFEKQERLWKKENVGSEVQFLEAKNRKESLESNLATLRSQLSKNELRAPFGGVVDRVFPRQGELTGPQTPVVRLINKNAMYIESDVPENYIRNVNVGTPVIVSIEALGIELDATINQVGDFINPGNRTFRIRINLENQNQMLRPNLMARVKVNDYNNDTALVIPARLIQQSVSGDDYVYTFEKLGANNGKVHRQPIKTGRSYAGISEILGGIKPETIIIDKGARSVKDQQRVTPVTE